MSEDAPIALDLSPWFPDGAELDQHAFWARYRELCLEHTGEEQRAGAHLAPPSGRSSGEALEDKGELELRIPTLDFRVGGPTPAAILERLERILEHRAEHGPPDHVVIDQTDGPDAVAKMVADGNARLEGPDGEEVQVEEVTRPEACPTCGKGGVDVIDLPAGGVEPELRCGDDWHDAQGHPITAAELEARAAALEEAEAEASDPRLLQAREYAGARAAVLNIANAVSPVTVDGMDRLIYTAEQSLNAPLEQHVLRNGMTEAQARESMEALELELSLFRAFRSFRKRLDDVREQAEAKRPGASVIGASAPQEAETGKPPPPPPNRRERRSRGRKR